MKLVPSLLSFSPFLLVLILSGFTYGQEVEEMETVDEDEYIPIASQSLNFVNDYLGVESIFENVVVGGVEQDFREPRNVENQDTDVEEAETDEISYFPVEVQSVMGQSFNLVNEYLGELSDFNAVVVVGGKQDGRVPRNVETLDIVEEEESYGPAEVLSIMTQTSQFLDDPYGLPSVFEDVWVAPRNEEGGTDSRAPRNVEIDDDQEEPYFPIEVQSLMGQTLDLSNDPYDFTSVFEEVWVAPRNEAGGTDSREPRNDDGDGDSDDGDSDDGDSDDDD